MMGSDELLMLQSWPDYSALKADDAAQQKMEWLISIISEIRSVRADMNVPAGAKIDLLVKGACEHSKAGLEAFDEILKRMARLENIECVDDAPKGSLQTVVGDITLILPIADLIDLDAERARLEKEISKLDGDIAVVDKKLANEKFVANAPKVISLISQMKIMNRSQPLLKRQNFAPRGIMCGIIMGNINL